MQILVLIAMVALPGEVPPLPISYHVEKLNPQTTAGVRAKSLYLSQVRAGEWSAAFDSAGTLLDELRLEPAHRWQIEFPRYDLLLLANRPRDVLVFTGKLAKPLGIYKGRVIAHPADWGRVMQDAGYSEDDPQFKRISDNYTQWANNYYYSL